MAYPSSIEVTLRPSGRVLQLAPGEKLLDGLRRHDVPISYSCEDGRCGLCCCRVLRGRVIEAARPPRPVLNTVSPYVLACQSSAAQDCVIGLPEAQEVVVHRPRKLKAAVISIESPLADLRILKLKVPGDFTFSPGQFVELQFSRDLIRVYSMADAGRDGSVTLHIQIHPHGKASHIVANELKPGDSLRINGPLGSAYLRTHNEDSIICVAAKTGLAPMLSILGAMAERKMANPVHVYCGFMGPEQVYGQAHLQEIAASLPNLQCVHCLVPAARPDSHVRAGLLTAAIEEDFGQLNDYRAYLFGSPFAIEATARLMLKKGLALEKLYADPFHISGD